MTRALRPQISRVDGGMSDRVCCRAVVSALAANPVPLVMAGS